MSIGPIDYYGELSPIEDEVEWPGTLPDYVEEWNELWFMHTEVMTPQVAELRRLWSKWPRNAA